MQRLLLFFERFDWVLLISVLALTSIGLTIIYGIGISHEPTDLFPFYKQLIGVGLGIALVSGLSILDFRQLRSLNVIIYLSGFALLLAVLLFGRTVRGTQGWFSIGSLSFQPVEVAKITLAIYLATFFSRLVHGRLSWKIFLQSAAATFVYVGMVMLQPDFGSAMVMLAMWGFMAIFAGLPRKAWIILPLIGLISCTLLWTVGLKPYQRDRIAAFLDPQSDLQGSGYNAAQARIAIGSGGWLGKGVGEGSQARLRFLPEAGTDFIFSVVGEELGFVGICVTILLFGCILYRFIRIALGSGDDFAVLLLVGLGSVLLIHLLINAGMNLGIMPITGIPLPFVSSAASSLVVTFIIIGLAESISMRRQRSIIPPEE